MNGIAILYIFIWIAVIVVGYLLICGVEKVVKEDKPDLASLMRIAVLLGTDLNDLVRFEPKFK